MRHLAPRALAVTLTGLLAACGDAPPPPEPPAGYDALAVEPAAATVRVALGGTGTQGYQVFGLRGGERTELTDGCTLTIDAAAGSFSGPLVTVGPRGGKFAVQATCGALTGAASLVVELTGTVVTPGTPADAPALFGAATAATDPARTPRLEYPLDRAVAPRNLPPVEAQWPAAGNDLFHLTLRAAFATIDVYTTGVEAALDAAAWEQLTATAAGGTLAFDLEALSRAAPATKYAAPTTTIDVSIDTIDRTAIYYWASSKGSIMSATFGSTAAPAQVRGACTSCHALSRAGTRLGYSRCVGGSCGQIYLGFLRFDQATASWVEKVDADARGLEGSYSTFAPVGNPFPDDSQALALVTRKGGTLALVDPDTGAVVPSNVGEVASHGPGGPRAALMADWSADGKVVAFASTPHPGQWIDLSDGAIATMSYDHAGGQHVFGEPDFLVSQPIVLPGGTYTNFFFPSLSPDGKLVVFNAARSAWRNGANAKAPGQRLMLADVASRQTVDLTALNGGGDNDITWPHWAPGASADYYWVVFASERDYGHQITAANTAPSCVANGVKQCKQIWIGAISRARLAAGLGVDPSAPPMWLPGQDKGADNISPFWTVPAVINRAPGAPAPTMPPAVDGARRIGL